MDLGYELDIKKIKPKNIKKSDKYSKQIYHYLKMHPDKNQVYYIQTQEVYNKETNEFEVKEVPFDIDNIRISQIWIGNTQRSNYEEGYIDWMYGNSLSTIVSSSKSKYTVFANPWNNKKTVVNVTEQFWEKYIEIGRCIYDHHYWLQDEEERYVYIDEEHRKCNWCGKEQHKKIVTHTYETKQWVDN